MKKKRWTWVLSGVVCLLLVASLAAPCLAASPCAARTGRVVRVAFPAQGTLAEVDESGQLGGYLYEYLKRLAEFTGWTYEFLPLTGMSENDALMRALEMVEQGEADLLGGLLKSEQMEELLDFPSQASGVVYTTLSVLENDAAISACNYMERDPLRVAVQRGAAVRQGELRTFLDQAGATYEEVLCDSPGAQMSALINGRADVMLRLSLSFVAGTREIARFAPRPYYFAATKGSTELLRQLDEGIYELNRCFPYFQSDLDERFFGDTSSNFYLSSADTDYVRRQKTIRVLCTTNVAPFVYLDKNGQPAGVTVSILKDFARAAGLEVDFALFDGSIPFGQALEQRVYDCILGIPLNASYNITYGIITSEPFLTVDTAIFTNHRSIDKPRSACVVALTRGSELASTIEAKEIRFYDSIEACVRAVNRGECDCGYGNSRCVDYAIENTFSSLSTVPDVGHSDDMGISVLKTADRQLLLLLNRYIKNVDSGDLLEYEETAKHGLEKNSLELFARTNPLLAIALCAVVLVLLFGSIGLYLVMRALQKKNRALASANAVKFNFLSRMSHDIRTPLNGIIGLTDLALADSGTDPRQDLLKIRTSAQFLKALVNDILDMNKLDNGKLQLKPRPYTGEELEGYIKAVIVPLCEDKHLRLSRSAVSLQGVTVLCDPLRINQILFNLLSNAVKFTPEGGEIAFRVEHAEQKDGLLSADYVVEDSGIGISEEFQAHLFEPFSREHTELTDRMGGTGLGLSITQQIVALMGGTIRVESKLGQGSRFTVHLVLPLAETEPKTAADAPRSPADLAGRRVLVCEDHPLNREIMGRLLNKYEILTEFAKNGQEGVDRFRASAVGYYDAVLMDIRMPIMDGLAATVAIRALDRADAAAPIIAMTANAFDEDVEKSRAAGMNAHLAKPVDPALLLATLAELLDRREDGAV